MMDPALLSVIIPAYNSASYLPAALESVAAQDYRPLEVIVVDDGSTDETAALAADFFLRSGLPGRYHYQPNQGPAAARNCGLTLANGAWVAFQDADDLWLPAKTTCQMQVLHDHPQAGVAWGCTITFAGDLAPDVAPASVIAYMAPRFVLQSMLFRRSALEQVGHFDPGLRLGEDVDWLFRAMEQAIPIVIHGALVLYYRRHANNLTSDADQTSRGLLPVLRNSLNRRRAQGEISTDRLSSLLILPDVSGILYNLMQTRT